MSYTITPYTYKQARKYGVGVVPSKNKTKKIDVIKNGRVIASVGAKGMNDFPTYMKKCGKTYAKTRRRLYKIRHNNDRKTRGTRGWWADKLLW
jgi:hypothetical protein